MKFTTIKLLEKTKRRLEGLKTHPKESYEVALERLLDLISLCRTYPEQAKLTLIKWEKAKELLRKPSSRLNLNDEQFSSPQRSRPSY